MKSFEDLVNEKHSTVKECKNFIAEIRNFYKSDENIPSNASILLDLIYQKIKIYESISYNNYDKTIKSIEDIDEKIYKQIYISKKDKSLENFNQEKCIKERIEKYIYKKSDKIKTEILKEIANFVLSHKWFSTMIFFAFGIFGILVYFENPLNDTRHISQLQLILISVTNIVFAILWSVFFVFLAYSYTVLEKNGDFKNPKFGFLYLSWFVLLMALLIMWIPAYILKDKLDVSYNLLISFAVTYIAISLCIRFRKNSKIMIGLYVFILVCIALLSIIITVYFKTNIFGIFLLLTSFVFIWLMATTSITSKTDIKFNTYLTITLILLGAISTAPNFTMSLIGYKEIDYKFISIDKKALNSLPDKICKEDCEKYFCMKIAQGNYICKNSDITPISYIDGNFTYKNNNTNLIKSIQNISSECFNFLDENQTMINIPKESELNFQDKTLTIQNNKRTTVYKNVSLKSNPKICMTYIESQDNDTFKIYNIKVLSALGKFYLLETKDKNMFEIDSNLIISKEKE
ncbi:hypothetical protein [Campylobacter sp.]|uniref:hypothetical protein n=1 Tax=Campylobacter sp. TaxID=205 RepID=UPI00270FB06F|nr:hypothetical protein [Campylobacter sp.]